MNRIYSEAIRQRTSPLHTAVVIGGGTGGSLTELRNLCCKHIVLTEAHPKQINKISKKIRSSANEQVLPLAISADTKGEATLHVYNNMAFNSLHTPAPIDKKLKNIQKIEEIEVPTKSLSALISGLNLEDSNNLLIINSPGYSANLIASAEIEILQKFNWLIVVELNSASSQVLPGFSDHLSQLGFEYIKMEDVPSYPFIEHVYHYDGVKQVELSIKNNIRSLPTSGESILGNGKNFIAKLLPQEAFELYWQSQRTGLASISVSACLANINAGNFLIARELLDSAIESGKLPQDLAEMVSNELVLKHQEHLRNLVPEISVIVPYHNREKIIKKCLDSVLNQTIKDIEVIVVDDGSTDNGRQIVADIDDDRLVRINCDTASGNSGTPRNIALKAARGTYVAFVDSDDTIDEEYFEELLIEAKKSKADITLSKSFTKLFNDAAGNAKKTKINYIFNPDFISENERKYFFINSFVIWDKLYKRDFMERNNIKLADSKIGADTLMVAKSYYYATSVAMCYNKASYNYNAFSEGSVTQAFRSKGDIREEDKPYAETFAWMKNDNIPKAYLLIQWIRRLMSLSYCLSSSKVELSSDSLSYLSEQLKEAPFKSAMAHLKKKNLNEQHQSISKLLTMLGR
ncbi:MULTISPECIES: glycosyltransferase family 2 protein [Pseudomonas]|uniref:glycosyltransferase family 2 protein n=1 Tax=Pseudomonas TaxID=286 RepID=UPI001BB08555|nr:MULTISPECIES: glycosyltransferase family 2 protein [Pseudomonas]MBS4086636.1 glycosyltransferase [Pseudomonas rustica]MEB0191005.1 glycosyltransferase family 2 protein [Pseudomonas sp. CCI1.1]WPX49371.1 glycosyltransferase family 2 protein [Pseudomonas sp. CCI1.1]